MRKINIVHWAMNEERMGRIIAAAPGFEVINEPDNFADCEIIFGNPPADALATAARLKWLHTGTAGVNAYCAPGVILPEGLVMTNSSGAFGISISEHLLTMAMYLMRKLGSYRANQNAHKWQNLGPVGTIYNAEVCVVGLGDIGGNFAMRCKALGARVTAVVRNPRKDLPPHCDAVFTADQIDQAIIKADIVALCLPGTADTAALFDAARLAKMKPASYILNIGRGNAIDTFALIDALQSGHIAGAGLDVTHPEPLPENSPLWDMENVIITPHISGRDDRGLTQDIIINKFCEYLDCYINDKPFPRTVNQTAGY